MVFCFFSAQYLPTVGGVERYTQSLARRLISAGHRAIVVTSVLPGLPERETDETGIKIFRLPVIPLMNGRFPMVLPSPKFWALTKELWALPIDFCVVQTRMYTSSVYAALAAKKRHIPTIVIEHSTGYMPMPFPISIASRCYENLACFSIRGTGARFYGVSQAVCRWMKHFKVEAAGTLYNSVDPEALQAAAEAQSIDWRKTLSLPESTRLLVSVGRIIPEKGVAELAQSFVSLNLTDVALLVAGDGPQLAELKANPLPGVHYLGSVPYPQTLQLYRQADLYCLPTRYAEGFPTTLLEAAALGCPILATDTAGSAELMPDESYGLRLPDNRPETLAPALKKALEDGAWRRTAAQKTQENLILHFTWEATAARLMEIAKGATEC